AQLLVSLMSFLPISTVELDHQRSAAKTLVNKMGLDIFVLFNIFNYCKFASYSEFDLNKRLRAPTQAFFSHLSCVAQPCFSSQNDDQISAAHITLEQHGDNLTVKLKSELAGLPFYWEFRCTAAPVGVCRQLVRPLLGVSRVLQRQVEDLAALLARKDAEIQDYQENGAVLSRARLQTELFEVHKYRENFFTKVRNIFYIQSPAKFTQCKRAPAGLACM
uniref:Nonhomologous end-joining factor 1 n=1 Tax=Sinocyclocheilus grahami TaxID=75366 RepID=A0A672TCG4_SINGR